jgi:hypothetical protein
MLKRRNFLVGGLAVIAAAAGGIFAVDIASEHELVSGVRRRLSMLKLDEAGLHAFAKAQIAALLAKRPSWYRWKYHFHSLFVKPVASWGISTDSRSRRERLEDYFATMYLLSSDFFTTGADETRVVNYVALYDPLRACGNPFARPPPDPQATA